MSKRQTHRTIHAILTLLISFGILVSTALLVPPAWWKGRPAPDSPHATPSPTPSLPAPQAKKQVSVCGHWISETSHKKYAFVCKDEHSLQINEVDSDGRTNSGSATITDNGYIKGDLFIGNKGRVAHLRLQVSSDGQRIQGSWVGDDPANETGILAFHRAEASE